MIIIIINNNNNNKIFLNVNEQHSVVVVVEILWKIVPTTTTTRYEYSFGFHYSNFWWIYWKNRFFSVILFFTFSLDNMNNICISRLFSKKFFFKFFSGFWFFTKIHHYSYWIRVGVEFGGWMNECSLIVFVNNIALTLARIIQD